MRTRPDFDRVMQMLNLGPKDSKQELGMSDRLHAETYSDHLLGVKLSESTQRVLKSYRIKLRQAEFFTLDDEAVKLICRLGRDVDRMAGWSFLARLPFPVMWVDFNLHTKVQEFAKMGTLMHSFVPENISKTAGYLFYQESDDSPRWIAHEFQELRNGGEIVPSMLAYIFDPEGDTKKPIAGSTAWNMPTLSRIPGFPRVPVNVQERRMGEDGKLDIGSTYQTAATVAPEFTLAGLLQRRDKTLTLPVRRDDQAAPEDAWENLPPDEQATMVIESPEWFAARAGAIIDPFWDRHLAEKPRQEVYKLVAHEVIEHAGIMRWLITMFASINALPREIKPINTRTGTYTAARRKQLPFFRQSNITIQIPRDNRIIWAKKHLDRQAHGARHAWHGVMGHWVIIEYGRKPPGLLCRHDPVMIENGVGLCQHCELMVRWREVPHGRGNPEIGIVEHRYTIAGGKRGRRS